MPGDGPIPPAQPKEYTMHPDDLYQLAVQRNNDDIASACRSRRAREITEDAGSDVRPPAARLSLWRRWFPVQYRHLWTRA